MEKSTIYPIPPHLPGLTWRVFIRDELGALVKLAVLCQRVDGGLAFLNEPDNLSSRYFTSAPGAGIGAFAADEQLVACSTVHLVKAANREQALIVGQVHPEWRDRGIGTYLMGWGKSQAQSLFSAGAANEKRLRIATESLTGSARRLYHTHGFELVDEHLVMQRDLQVPLPDCPVPSDVGFTTWQPGLADQFFRAYDAAFRERPGFPGYTAREWISNLAENQNFRHDWSLLARVGDLPAGFVAVSAEQPGGYVVQVGVIPGQRRRGLGSALLVETMRRMQAAGKSAAQLTVSLNNPGAIQTYIALGFATVGRRAKYERIADPT